MNLEQPDADSTFCRKSKFILHETIIYIHLVVKHILNYVTVKLFPLQCYYF